MHRKSLTGEAKLNRDKAMLNDYIAGMHIAELAEKYGIDTLVQTEKQDSL